MTAGNRLSAEQRRARLVTVGAEHFARRAYDDVIMEDVARAAGVSRALLYRHFPSKKDLFAAVCQEMSDSLLAATELDPTAALADRVASGLDAHIDYFVAHRHTVLAANRVLAGDPTIQAILSGEMAVLRERLLASMAVPESSRDAVSAVLMGWFVFVQVMCVEWLDHERFSREELRDRCVGALLGALSGADSSRGPSQDDGRG